MKDRAASQLEGPSAPSEPMRTVLGGLARHIDSLLDRLDPDSASQQAQEIEGLVERMEATQVFLEQWLEEERNPPGSDQA